MRALATAALHLATTLVPPAMALVRQLAQAALWATLFALAVWVTCRLAPRLPAGVRCGLWWLVSLKLLIGLGWPAPLTLPVLPPAAAAAAAGWLAPPPPSVAAPAKQPLPARLATAVLVTRDRETLPARPPAPPPAAAFVREHGAASAVPGRPRSLSAEPFSAPAAPTAPAAAGATAHPSPAWWALALASLWLAGLLRQLALTVRELRRLRTSWSARRQCAIRRSCGSPETSAEPWVYERSSCAPRRPRPSCRRRSSPACGARWWCCRPAASPACPPRSWR